MEVLQSPEQWSLPILQGSKCSQLVDWVYSMSSELLRVGQD